MPSPVMLSLKSVPLTFSMPTSVSEPSPPVALPVARLTVTPETAAE